MASGLTKGIVQIIDVSDDYDFAIAAHTRFGQGSYYEHLNALKQSYPIPSAGWELGALCGDDVECASSQCARLFDFDEGTVLDGLFNSAQICMPEDMPIAVKFKCVEDAVKKFRDTPLQGNNLEGWLLGLQSTGLGEALCAKVKSDLSLPLVGSLLSDVGLCLSNLGIPITVYLGLSGEGAVGLSLVGTAAYAIDLGGNEGCALTGCVGVGIEAGKSLAAVLGIGFFGYVEDLKGPSWGMDVDAGAVAKIGFGVQVGSTGMTVVEFPLGAGAGGGISYNGCETTVSILIVIQLIQQEQTRAHNLFSSHFF